MKKILSVAFIALLVFIVACSKNHDNSISPVDPAQEKDTIDNFIAANNITGLTQDTLQGATGLMSHIINPGNLQRKVADSIPVIYFKLTGKLLNGQTFYSSGATDEKIDFFSSNNTQLSYYLVLSGVVNYYLHILGEGGSVTCVTPSYYAYATKTVPFPNLTIPPNSPLYYSNITIDSIRRRQ